MKKDSLPTLKTAGVKNAVSAALSAKAWLRAAGTLALIGSALAAPVTAQAQSDQTTGTRVSLIEPLTITKLSDLDFGDLVPGSGGTVVLTSTPTQTCTTTGGVIHAAECQAATFGGSGATGQRVRIRRPIGRIITLTGPGADMTVTDITINGDPSLTATQSNPNFERFRINSADGTFIFRVGGTLNVGANQEPGIYTGTFDIRLDYQ